MLPIAFPASLDAFVNPSASSKLNDQLVPHSEQHARLNDAVVALQVKVGVDESEDASSLDAKVSALQAGKSDTSHTHDTRYYTESEVDALIAAIPSGDPSAAWPVGSVFISVVNTNPATLLGFGTWALRPHPPPRAGPPPTETTNPTTATNQAATAVNQNTGGDAAHPNVQPYITVRMWKRTA
jgi:hypothetical protein